MIVLILSSVEVEVGLELDNNLFVHFVVIATYYKGSQEDSQKYQGYQVIQEPSP